MVGPSSDCAIYSVVLFSLETKTWKIADFGLTSEGTSNRLITTRYSRGRPCYRAPELLRETEGRYSNKSDIWSLGCIVYELVIGKKPFSGDYAVITYAISLSSLMPYSNDASSYLFRAFFIDEFLTVKPTERPSAERVKVINQITRFFLTSTSFTPRGSIVAAALPNAVSLGRLDIVKFILKDVSERNKSPDWTEVCRHSLELALIHRHKDIVEQLVSAGTHGGDALCNASCDGDHEAIYILLNAGVDVNSTNHLGYSALHYATLVGQDEAATILIKAGGTLQSPDGNHDAISAGRMPIEPISSGREIESMSLPEERTSFMSNQTSVFERCITHIILTVVRPELNEDIVQGED